MELRLSTRRLLLGATVGTLLGLAGMLGVGQNLEDRLIDYRLQAWHKGRPSPEIVLVGVSDADIATFGSWPFPRGVHSDVIQILEAMKPAHISMDILFNEASEDPGQDQQLLTSINQQKNITLPYYFEKFGFEDFSPGTDHFLEGRHYGYDPGQGDLPAGADAVGPFTKLDCTFGASNGIPSRPDGKIREAPLFIQQGSLLYPSLAMQTLMASLKTAPDQITVQPGRFVTLTNSPRGTLRFPISKRGLYRINYQGDLESFTGLDYSSLYRSVKDPEFGRKVRSAVEGKMVLVGYVATGSYDTLNTPIGPMPGLVVHANLLSNLWSGQHLWLPPSWLELVILPIFGLAAGAVMALRRTARLASVLVLGLAALSICLAAAREDIMLPMAGLAGTWGVLLCAAGLLKNTLTNPEGLAPSPSLPKVLLPKRPQTGSTGLSKRVSHPPSIRNPELPGGMDSNDAETVQMDATVTWQSPAWDARPPDEKISPEEENTSLRPPAP